MDKVGKKFETKLREDWLKSIPDSTIDRLYDSVSGFKSISNISDFIGYKMPNIFYIEAKTIKGKLFPFSNLTQYDKLIKKVGIPGVRAGVIIWFYEEDLIIYAPISTITQIKESGRKSISIKMVEDKLYNIVKIPSIKKRTFMDSDYSILTTLKDGE